MWYPALFEYLTLFALICFIACIYCYLWSRSWFSTLKSPVSRRLEVVHIISIFLSWILNSIFTFSFHCVLCRLGLSSFDLQTKCFSCITPPHFPFSRCIRSLSDFTTADRSSVLLTVFFSVGQFWHQCTSFFLRPSPCFTIDNLESTETLC